MGFTYLFDTFLMILYTFNIRLSRIHFLLKAVKSAKKLDFKTTLTEVDIKPVIKVEGIKIFEFRKPTVYFETVFVMQIRVGYRRINSSFRVAHNLLLLFDSNIQ